MFEFNSLFSVDQDVARGFIPDWFDQYLLDP